MILQAEWNACPCCRTKVIKKQVSASHPSEQPESQGQREIETDRENKIAAERRQQEEKEAKAQQVKNDELMKVKAQQDKEAEAVIKRNVIPTSFPINDNVFADIPAGSFIMGSPEDEEGRDKDETQHKVDVESFQLMKTPVIFAQYEKYCKLTNIKVPDDEGWGRGGRPLINVSYWDAIDFCEWLTNQSGKVHRLPTEAEWEYACRAGSSTVYSYGDKENKSKMHYLEASTSSVAKFPANVWGLYDMHGNVWEWCSSVWDENYSGKEQLDASSERGNNEGRILRGGAWYSGNNGCRSARHLFFSPEDRYGFIGFRIARDKKVF